MVSLSGIMVSEGDRSVDVRRFVEQTPFPRTDNEQMAQELTKRARELRVKERPAAR